MANVLGIFADAVWLFSAAMSLFPGPPNWSSTTVRIHTGLNGDCLSGADGNTDNVRIYNANQEIIGILSGAGIGSGDYCD